MKIVHIIPNLKIGGAERLVQDICSHIYENNKAEIRLITFHSGYQIKYAFHKIINSYFVPSLTFNSKIKTDDLQNFINEFKPDIIHSHLWETEVLLTKLKYKKTIRFSHFHDNMIQLEKKKYPKNKRQLTDIFEKKLFLKKNDNHFICIARDSYEFAIKNLPKKNKIYLLPNAINFDKFFPLKKQYSKQIRIINIGSFVKKKNQAFAIKVLKNIIDKGINAKLTFLGDGELRNEVENLAIKLGVINNIKFFGNVQNPEDYLKESNLYLHTATYEPFGLVILEAMASGLPVISLDGKGNRDIIINGKNGVIINEENIDLFTQNIISIFEDKNFKKKLINEGYKTATKYDIKHYVDKLFSIYKEAISLENSV